MTKEKADVVIFPKWKTSLEENGLAALKAKKYEEALEHFDQLIQFEAANSEVLTGKLIALMELGRYTEAETICRDLMKLDDGHYFQYLHIYLTVLFQTSQYEELIDLLDEVFKSDDIPQELRQQFWQLYDITEKLKVDETKTEHMESLDEFLVALDTEDVKTQWQLLSKLRKTSIQPYLNDVAPYLKKEHIQPVIKTALLQWMQEQQVERNVEVQKLGESLVVNPSELSDILAHPSSIHILNLLNEVEQNNPTLYEFIQQLLFRYMYVRFPIMPNDKELPSIAKALFELSSTYLQLENEPFPMASSIPDDSVDVWKQQIEYYEVHYFSVLDE
ncbi:tetratricopeptide repeat protein [Pontibacillus yanchengensis]|uniref:Tetratricopeptide repeat protein n=2 Tax=Pontibacillus yanchengensis TaxID=462910 RepID=A0ACC7VFE6_9BACI|nr:tetratricopeptide repeat protein [Pontibacillus yanchengensis]MYL34208.1 tetratricopeptide repeat protein [Pontibacillus yanchengensis]MYL53325.1 tetratricopeptide repeat protein [Pontibacillus yanchengensis]